jgi:e3 binding domain
MKATNCKLQVGDGSKAVKVGTRIAVLGDEGDDVSSLEIPKDEAPAQSTKAEQAPPPETAKSDSKAEQEEVRTPPSEKPKPPGEPQKQRYPLYSSVIALMHERGMDLSDADKIPASGPSGRLLKGDVLAYLGTINSSTPSEISKYLDHLSHLDLSNIKVAERQPQQKPPADAAPQAEVPPQSGSAQIALSISFKAIREVQKRVHDALGVHVPLETFITRAIDISNTDLPASKSRAPTADELFDEIVGVNHVRDLETHGAFLPQIIAVAPSRSTPASSRVAKPDIIDILTGVAPKPPTSSGLAGSPVNESTPSSIFALTVPKGEEDRAKIFLERVKTILQVEPGRLVL